MNICYPVRRTVYLELCFKFKQINGIENMYPLPSAAVIHYEEALYQVYGPTFANVKIHRNPSITL